MSHILSSPSFGGVGEVGILPDGVGDLVPDELVEGAVLRLCFEGGYVGGCFGSVHQALAGGGTDSAEACAVGDFGLGGCGGAVAAYVGEIGCAGVGGGSGAVHIGDARLLGYFAREVVNRVEIGYFSHFGKMKN